MFWLSGGSQSTPSATKPSGGSNDPPMPTWVKVAQTQIEAANKAILELSGVAGLLGQQQKVLFQFYINYMSPIEYYLGSRSTIHIRGPHFGPVWTRGPHKGKEENIHIFLTQLVHLKNHWKL